MYLAVNNEKADNLYNYVDEKIVPELEKISSVASVDISGGREEYIRVEVIPEKLKQYHLSMNSLVTGSRLRQSGLVRTGSTEVGSQSLSVTTGVDLMIWRA